MPRTRHTSPQTLAVLSVFDAAPSRWRYGLELSRETGLKSGTLYPLLVRLAEQGFLEAAWQPSEQAGRPPRHAYRLTAQGWGLARERTASRPAPALRPALGKA